MPPDSDLRSALTEAVGPGFGQGLEFDTVVIVDPERIRAHTPTERYVSMTRATQRLGPLKKQLS